MAALALVVGGLIAYRWDLNLSGQLIVMPYLSNAPKTLYTSYVPSFIEIVVGTGIVAYGTMAITLGVKFLRVVDHGVEGSVVSERVSREPYLAAGD